MPFPLLQLFWENKNAEHIARHGVGPDEVEEVCFDQATLFTRAGQRRYQAIGQTAAGRYLAIFPDRKENGIYYPVTARRADDSERRLFQRLRR